MTTHRIQTPNNELTFTLQWNTTPAGPSAANQTYGTLHTQIRNQPVWHGATKHQGLEWTWIELLEHLNWAWPHLTHDKHPPPGHTPKTLHQLLNKNRPHINNQLGTYLETHNLANGISAAIPPLLIIRDGTTGWAIAQNATTQLPYTTLINTLSELGDHINQKLTDTHDNRATTARQEWATRHTRKP